MDNKESLLDNLEFVENDVVYLKLCLDITVYWVGSIFDRREGVLDFYTKSMNVIGTYLTFYETETMRGAAAVRTGTLDLVPMWLTRPSAKRSTYMLYLESGSSVESVSDFAFTLRAMENEQVGAMRLVLPTHFITKSVNQFLDLAQSLVQKLDINFGHGGYSLNWNEVGRFASFAEKEIYILSQRYPGIDIPDLAGTLDVLSQGVKCANWLTLLDETSCNRLGGMINLQSTFSKEIKMHKLNKCIMIQAGPRPRIGDINRLRKLSFYNEVGRVIAGLRATDHPAFIKHGENIYDEDISENWLGRFDH